jgi:UPF0755 protein
MKKRKILVVVVIVFSVLLTSFSFYAYQLLYTPNVLVEQQARSFIIRPGESFEQVRNHLYEEGYINEAVSFSFLSKLLKYDENVKPGHYVIAGNMSNLEAIRLLRSGQQTALNVTFHNIRTKEVLAERLSQNLMAEKEEILRMMNDPAITASYGFDTLNIVSMFIPNTYEFFWTTSGEELFDRMHTEYQKFWTDERLQKAERLGLDPKEVSVLASIVQAETNKKDEMPRVAGVYLNRLNRNMLLQADPTLVFAAQDFSIKRVLDEHKAIDSPYNTYKYAGLPPGPINLPAGTTVDAVLNAEDHKYIFFCAKDDFSGYHNFAATYREHMKNARKWQRALNERKVYR